MLAEKINGVIYKTQDEEFIKKGIANMKDGSPREARQLYTELVNILKFDTTLKYAFNGNEDLFDKYMYKMDELDLIDLLGQDYLNLCKKYNVNVRELIVNYLFLDFTNKNDTVKNEKDFKLLFASNIRASKRFLDEKYGVAKTVNVKEGNTYRDIVLNTMNNYLTNVELVEGVITEIETVEELVENTEETKIEQDFEVADLTEKEIAFILYKTFGSHIEKIQHSQKIFFDWDIKVFFKYGFNITIEIKHDSLSFFTQNTCLEYKNNNQNAPSGIAKSKADFYMIKALLNVWSNKASTGEMKNDINSWFLIPNNRLKRLAINSLFFEKKTPFFQQPMGFIVPFGGDKNKNTGKGNSRMINLKTSIFSKHSQQIKTVNNVVNPAEQLCKLQKDFHFKKDKKTQELQKWIVDFFNDNLDLKAISEDEEKLNEINSVLKEYIIEKYK